jgi:hypothetical protein
MPESNVLPFGMNDESLRRRIAQLAANSSNVFITPHAKARMRERHVLRTQVNQVLVRGRVVERAHLNVHGNWQCTLEEVIAGDRIRVAAAVETSPNGDQVIVITVMN